MKAAVKTRQGDFHVREVADLSLPHPTWAKMRIKVAGICGTDLRHWKKEEPELEGKIMGHELSGEIVEVGADVKHLAVGDRVVLETVLGDEDCEWCRVQQYNRCPHLYDVRMETVSRAFAEHVVGPANKFYKLPANVSFEEAALLDTFSVCLHALQVSRLRINDRVVVIGAGPIGLGQLQLAKACGADVLVTDVLDSALDLARELGADEVLNTRDGDGREKVMEFGRGRGADVVFECAGGESMATTLPQACSYVRIGGQVVVVGGFEEDPSSIPLPWQHIQKGEIQISMSASYAYWDIDPEMQMCIDLVSKGKLNAKKLISHHVQLDEINKGFEIADAKDRSHCTFVAIHC